MRILFCCPSPLTATLGAAKVYLEVAEGFRRIGWDVVVVGPDEVAGGPAGGPFDQPARLRDYLRRHGPGFDVVEYEHHQLPFPRSDFPPGPLFVARSILLAHLVAATRIPPRPRLSSRIGRILRGGEERSRLRRLVRQADLTLGAADLINVCNEDERAVLIRHGHPAGKIGVFRYGLFPERLASFRPDPGALPDPPVVGFVGTFDPRKGMCEFPDLVARIVRRSPGATFRLLGTAGMIPDGAGVRGHFPRRLRPRLDVRPRFDPADLPGLLGGVSVGVFPSRLESFGFGVVEMLAAAVPVVAYDAPGPRGLLPEGYRVPVGATRAMAEVVGGLLNDPDRLRAARRWARAHAADFRWERQAAETAAVYAAHLARRAEPARS